MSPTQPGSCQCPVDPQKPPASGHVAGTGMHNVGLGCTVWDRDAQCGTGMHNVGPGCTVWDRDAWAGIGISLGPGEPRGQEPMAQTITGLAAADPARGSSMERGGCDTESPRSALGKLRPGMNEGSVLRPRHGLPAFSRLPAWNGAGNAAEGPRAQPRGGTDTEGGPGQPRAGWGAPLCTAAPPRLLRSFGTG